MSPIESFHMHGQQTVYSHGLYTLEGTYARVSASIHLGFIYIRGHICMGGSTYTLLKTLLKTVYHFSTTTLSMNFTIKTFQVLIIHIKHYNIIEKHEIKEGYTSEDLSKRMIPSPKWNMVRWSPPNPLGCIQMKMCGGRWKWNMI